jgi:hypothetical protein
VSEGLQLYPSGFLGSPVVALTAPLPADQAFRTDRWVGAVQQPNLMLGMRDVEDLFAAVRAGDPGVNDFAFRERILKTAKRAFGMLVFGDWVKAQKFSPGYCDYHQRWIEETVQYVILDKRREYTYNVWVGVLDAAPASKTNFVNKLSDSFFALNGPYRDLRTTQFIELWCQRERGVLDLLESLHVLFGTR